MASMSAADASGTHVYMDALLTPNRSLSRRGLWLLMGVLVVYNLLIAVFLFAIGAFPVPVFLGLDFLGLFIAFRVSNRRAGRAERVHVTADRVRVSRRPPKGREQTVWSSPTAFTRVLVEQVGEHDAQVRLRLSNRMLSVGASLSPEERSSFAEALQRAIRSARSERYAS
jgi:uncharacterized membrane protein